jgi:hypothetical protein
MSRSMVSTPPTSADLVKQYTDFCERHGMAESSFGLKMLNDGSLISDLRNGRELTMKSLRRIAAGMEAIEADMRAAA